MILELHPNYIQKEGKNEFVVLSIKEYSEVEKLLNDYEDLMDLRKAKSEEGHKKSSSLDTVKKMLDIQ